MSTNRTVSIRLIFIATALSIGLGSAAIAQKKTIILVRHAEKDISETADKNDPMLTTAGVQRSQRLVEIVKRYKPGAVYSTNLKRTQTTVEPIARHRKLEIKIYDPRKQNELIDEIMRSKTKRFVVSGHSNTIPGLANALGKKELFKNLDESEYGAIWIIRIKDGQVRKIEVLSY